MTSISHSPDINPRDFLNIHLEKGVGIPRVVDLLEAVNADLAKRWGTGNSALTDPVKAVEYAGHGGWSRATISLNKSIRYLTIMACADVSRVCFAALAAASPSFGLAIKSASNQFGPYQVLARR
jgi:hypothetical protein